MDKGAGKPEAVGGMELDTPPLGLWVSPLHHLLYFFPLSLTRTPQPGQRSANSTGRDLILVVQERPGPATTPPRPQQCVHGPGLGCGEGGR